MDSDDKTGIVKAVLDFIKESNISRLFQLTLWAFVSYFLWLILTDTNRAEQIYAAAFQRPAVVEKKLLIRNGEDCEDCVDLPALTPIICVEVYCIKFEQGVTEERNRLRLESQSNDVTQPIP